MGDGIRYLALALGLASGLAGSHAPAAGLSLTIDPPAPRAVGDVVTLNITGQSPDPVDFRLLVREPGGTPRVVYDFSPRTEFSWVTLEQGNHVLRVDVRNLGTGEVSTLANAVYARSAIAVDTAVISPTSHPLVALYSAPGCAAGRQMRVAFRRLGTPPASRTPARPCAPERSLNVYVGGMRGNTTHELWHEILDAEGQVLRRSAPRTFATGTPDREVAIELLDPADASTSRRERVVLQSATGLESFPFATDLAGQLIWYFDTAPFGSGRYVLNRPLPGGTFLVRAPDESDDGQRLWQIDMAGNILRETTAARVSEQVVAAGHDAITAFHHESRLLPNGHIAVLGYIERLLTDVQGPGEVDVLADIVVVLDRNLQVAWVWNAFDHLDPGRAAILDEKCVVDIPGCPPIALATQANDWLHSNAIAYDPTDGSLILSVRHQDWIVKIDYRDGSGNGQVLWRLGPNGDFALSPDAAPADPFPWLSHPHDPNYIGPGTILVYDNANTRCEFEAICESRGQIYQLDEIAMQATLSASIDTGYYAPALGSAQLLDNGNIHLNNGSVASAPVVSGIAAEYGPDGALSYAVSASSLIYRSFRMRDLYTPP